MDVITSVDSYKQLVITYKEMKSLPKKSNMRAC